MNNLIIDKMKESDIPEIAKLEKICFSQPWSPEGLKAELDNELACFVVAKLVCPRHGCATDCVGGGTLLSIFFRRRNGVFFRQRR